MEFFHQHAELSGIVLQEYIHIMYWWWSWCRVVVVVSAAAAAWVV